MKGFAERTEMVKIGSGLDADTQMGPLANARRAPALAALVADAKAKGARVIAGGEATGDGYFFQPTAIADVPIDADAMNNEPFGPMALIRPFGTEEEALEQANRLPYGLAAFAFTGCAKREEASLVPPAPPATTAAVDGERIANADSEPATSPRLQ